jgi:hypothetical protein
MSLNETKGVSYEVVLPLNDTVSLLNKTEFIDYIVNSCNDSCPTNFTVTELDGTEKIPTDMLAWNVSEGIIVNQKLPQFYDLQIRGQYLANG